MLELKELDEIWFMWQQDLILFLGFEVGGVYFAFSWTRLVEVVTWQCDTLRHNELGLEFNQRCSGVGTPFFGAH